MKHTRLSIQGDRFLLNGNLTYSEYPNCPPAYRGLLMNARLIQGIFDDKAGTDRYHRFGRRFDAERNTDDLIAALPSWYEAGLRAFTVGMQGGGPCFTVSDMTTMINNPYSEDGTQVDRAYLHRLDRLISAADKLGMVVIVSYFYGVQSRLLKDDRAVMEAVKVMSNHLRDKAYTNVIIEIANEQDIAAFRIHPILYNEKGVAQLIDLARRESGGMPVGCSLTGGQFSEVIANASDVILIHGNGCTRQRFYALISRAKAISPKRPIICNEDSQDITNMGVAFDESVSWGYYNNMTKQEPPADWGITDGEDRFFAWRMSEYLGQGKPLSHPKEGFYLQGLGAEETCDGKRWIRLASLYPEKIDKVIFKRNGVYYATAYVPPFSIGYIANWKQHAIEGIEAGEMWSADVHLTDGTVYTIEKTAQAPLF